MSPPVLSAEKFKFWAVDYVRKQVTIVLQHGESVTVPLDKDQEVSGIKVSIFDWEKWWITTVTERDHLIITVGFNAERPDPGPHRPTVYLDQNKWSLLAAAMFAPDKVADQRELRAAKEVLRFARDDGIILPLSSAHFLETSALHTNLRYEVGYAMASLSGGWQMRHPLNSSSRRHSTPSGAVWLATMRASHNAPCSRRSQTLGSATRRHWALRLPEPEPPNYSSR